MKVESSDYIGLQKFFMAHGAGIGERRIIRPFHLRMMRGIVRWMAGKLPGGKLNLSIGVPPGHTKTYLAHDTISYSLGLWPDCQWLYTSYSASLAIEQTEKIKAALNSEWYRTIFPHVGEFVGEKHKFRNRHRGLVYGAGVDGTITGFRGGQKRNYFSGGILCFPYSEKVCTDQGLIEIGKIVDGKMDVKAYSYNFDKNVVELQNVDAWYENPGSDIIEVIFSDGEKLNCTPDHKVWTDNRGWVEAASLLPDDSIPVFVSEIFDSVNADSKEGAQFFPFARRIAQNVKFLFGKLFSELPRVVFPSLFGYRRPRFSCSNLPDNTVTYPISFAQNGVMFRAGCNFDSLLSREFCPGASFKNGECSVSLGVRNVFASSSIGKVFKAVISWIAVQVSNLFSGMAFTNESLKDGTVDSPHFDASSSKTRSKIKMPAFIVLWNDYLFGNRERCSVLSDGESFFASDSTHVGCAVKSKSGRYRTPVLIRHVGFSKKTYCISVRSNHNLFIHKSQAILVSNCDDPLKASEARSETVRKNTWNWYTGTLLSRKNRADTPQLMIAQRLHPEDLTGMIKQHFSDTWYFLEIPGVDEEAHTTIWPETFSYSDAMRLKEVDPFAYYSQYQQSPVYPGGSLIRDEWWKFFDETEDQIKRKCDALIITADTAFSEKTSADDSVLQLWGMTSTECYLIDQIRGKWAYETLLEKVIEFWQKHSDRGHDGLRPTVDRMYIENKASGLGLLGQAKTFRRHGINAFPWDAKKFVRDGDTTHDKVARVNQAKLSIFGGKVLLPSDPDIQWVDGFIAECSAFNAEMTQTCDDAVDAMTMAVLCWQALGEGRI